MTRNARGGRIGVSGFLPKLAATLLVQAATKARGLKEGSFERRRAVEDAILEVKARWPQYFRKD